MKSRRSLLFVLIAIVALAMIANGSAFAAAKLSKS